MLLGSATFAFLAGVLSTLSPCVLPLLPIILATAVSEHRLGPLALAVGLAASFVAVGLFVATIGFSIGIDAGAFRIFAALLLMSIGVILLVPPLQVQFATAAAPISGWAESSFGGFSTGGLSGQFALGLLLGAVWSPCVGPTLGAASVLAAQGQDLTHVALVMLAFGLGAALPLLLLGMLSRETLLRWRSRLADAGKGGKIVLGLLLIAVGLALISGFDKRIETAALDTLPAWFTEISTRY
jgi:cytochrome c biogenesis protein CcdA